MARASQDLLGKYRLLNIVMTGQTSQVWEAIDDAQSQRYAIKLLLSDFRKEREHVAFLKNEYAVGKSLEHPRVIRIYEYGSDKLSPYLVMELYPHPNMKQFLRRGLAQVGYLVPQVIGQAAEALAYFNDQGWVHRDIKPDNFLVSPQGDVKLIDFAMATKPKTGLMKLFARKTKTQGTRSYMSPEQIRGLALDTRADVYSFGCTIFELVGGRAPFTGGSSNELLMKHLKSPPPPLGAANPNVTPEFADLVKKTLAKRPEQRPESMSEFLREFRSLRVFKEMPKPPVEKPAAG
ncbi:MAG: serine/threonine protein kinase [Planctomycetaceae bacterium]|nr:serine/threonine protein kinase [Planctomycetaceae bacterium]